MPTASTLPGEDAFRFRHLLIRDAAYEAIPKAQRAELHERFADWLERVGRRSVERTGGDRRLPPGAGLRVPEAARPGGRAFGRARSPGGARLAAAGRRASARGDFPAAVNLLRRAVSLGPLEADARVPLPPGRRAQRGRRSRGTLAAFDEAARLAAVSGDLSLEWLARIWRSEVQMNAEFHQPVLAGVPPGAGGAIRAFEELGDEAGLATSWTKLAFLEFIPCRFERAALAAPEPWTTHAVAVTIGSSPTPSGSCSSRGPRALPRRRRDVERWTS